jgi:glutaconate CoA-transferase subunit A
MNKRMTPSDVVGELRDGMTIGIGGWGGRRKPMALVREIVSSPLQDLTIVAYGGPDVGLLCAAGKVKKLIFGFVSLDVIPLEAHFRAARQGGKIEVMEIDEGMLHWGLRAAAMRLPFLPTRVGLGTDVEHLNPEIKSVQSPYPDGETLLAMPALELDAALVHANQADERGNSQILGPDPFFDDLFCRAAKKAYVSCERIVETQEFHAAGCIHTVLLDRSIVDGVVEIPFGAHPTSCAPDYGIDEGHLKTYSAAAKGEGGFENYYREFLAGGQDAYLKAVGGADQVSALPLPVF